MDGRVDVGGAGGEAGLENRHVDERGAEVHDDLRIGLADQRDRRVDIEGIEVAGVESTGLVFHIPHASDAFEDGLALLHRAGGNADVTEHVVVECRLVGRNMGHTAGADDEHVPLHSVPTPLRFIVFTGSSGATVTDVLSMALGEVWQTRVAGWQTTHDRSDSKSS